MCVDLNNWHNTQSAVKSLGPIDLLVNNAGVANLTPMTDVTDKEFDWQVANTLLMAVNLLKAFLSCFCIH